MDVKRPINQKKSISIVSMNEMPLKLAFKLSRALKIIVIIKFILYSANSVKSNNALQQIHNRKLISPFQNEQGTGTEFKTLIQLKYLEN
jgi:hypothetical protein